jgi:chromosome segregation protein
MQTQRQERDRVEQKRRDLHRQQQQLEWQQQKLQENSVEPTGGSDKLTKSDSNSAPELPSPLPEVPEKVDLEQLQKELRVSPNAWKQWNQSICWRWKNTTVLMPDWRNSVKN